MLFDKVYALLISLKTHHSYNVIKINYELINYFMQLLSNNFNNNESLLIFSFMLIYYSLSV